MYVAVCVFIVGTHTNSLPKQGTSIQLSVQASRENTALTLSMNSTNDFLLFTGLADQDEGLLVGYMSVIWYGSLQQLVLDTQSIQELSPVSQVSYLLHYTSSSGLRRPVYPVIHAGALELPLILMYALRHTCAPI